MCEEVGLVLVRSRKHPVFPVPACGCGVSVLNSKFVSDLTLIADTAQYTSDMCVCVCVYMYVCARTHRMLVTELHQASGVPSNVFMHFFLVFFL